MLKSIGLRQLPCGRPEKVVRVHFEPEGEVKDRLLIENRGRIILQKVGGKPMKESLKTKVEILTD
jgi:hypothetical protein